MDVVLDGHILTAALTFFEMESTSSVPCSYAFPSELQSATVSAKKQYLFDVVGKFIDKFVLSYAADAKTLLAGTPTQPGEDGVHNYACSVMTHGLLARAFRDASREGDGERLLRYWKFLLLHF